jgi:hypothetical protein
LATSGEERKGGTRVVVGAADPEGGGSEIEEVVVAEKGGINMGSRRRGKGSISKVKANISHIKGWMVKPE